MAALGYSPEECQREKYQNEVRGTISYMGISTDIVFKVYPT